MARRDFFPKISPVTLTTIQCRCAIILAHRRILFFHTFPFPFPLSFSPGPSDIHGRPRRRRCSRTIAT